MQPPEPSATVEKENLSAIEPEPTKHLVLVGASVRAAAKSAKTAGLSVTGVDLFGDLDTRRYCDRFATFDDLSTLTSEELDAWLGTVPKGPFLQVGGLLGGAGAANREPVVQRLGDRRVSLRATDSQEDRLRDPGWLRQMAAECEIHFPETRACYELDRLSSADATGKKWLLKSGSPSCGGLGIRRIGTLDICVDEGASSSDWLQRWTSGRPFGATFFSDGRSVSLLGICRSATRRIGALPFVYAGSYGPIVLSDEITKRVSLLGQTIVDQIGLTGIFGVDLLIDRDGAMFLLEVNPRWTGSTELIERDLGDRIGGIRGQSLVGAMVSGVNATEMREAISRSGANGSARWKRIVYSRERGALCHDQLSRSLRIRDLTDAVDKDIDSESTTYRIADLPRDGQLIEKDAPIMSVLVTMRGGTTDDVRRQLACGKRIERIVQAAVG